MWVNAVDETLQLDAQWRCADREAVPGIQLVSIIFVSLPAGPARYTQSATILYSPNDTTASAVMSRFAQVAYE